MEAAARFLEGRKSIDVPYVVDASLCPAQAPDMGLTLAVVWIETGYSASSLHFYIGGQVYDIQFPVRKVRDDRSPLLEDVERQIVLEGTVREDAIEWHVSDDSTDSAGSSGAVRTQTTPLELITGQALLRVCTDSAKRSNSVDIFIHPDVRRMAEENSK